MSEIRLYIFSLESSNRPDYQKFGPAQDHPKMFTKFKNFFLCLNDYKHKQKISWQNWFFDFPKIRVGLTIHSHQVANMLGATLTKDEVEEFMNEADVVSWMRNRLFLFRNETFYRIFVFVMEVFRKYFCFEMTRTC